MTAKPITRQEIKRLIRQRLSLAGGGGGGGGGGDGTDGVLATLTVNGDVVLEAFEGFLRAQSGGQLESLSIAQVTAALDIFTSTLRGLVPASGGGTTNFLRADGSWAIPPGTAGSAWYFDPPLASDFPTNVTAGTPTNTSITDDVDVGLIIGTSLSSEHMFGYVTTPPSLPHTITTRFSAVGATGNTNAANMVSGIIIRNNSSQLRQVIGILNFNQMGFRRVTGTTFGAAGGVDIGIDPRHGLWLQVENTTTDHFVRISDSGKSFIPWVTLNGANYVTSFDQIGLAIAAAGNNGTYRLTCDHWEVT